MNNNLYNAILSGYLAVNGIAFQIIEKKNMKNKQVTDEQQHKKVTDEQQHMNRMLCVFNTLTIGGTVAFGLRYLLKK